MTKKEVIMDELLYVILEELRKADRITSQQHRSLKNMIETNQESVYNFIEKNNIEIENCRRSEFSDYYICDVYFNTKEDK